MKSVPSLLSVTAVALSLALGLSAAQAHDNATLDARAAPHGGQVRMAGAYHFELVVAKDSKDARDNPVEVYVTDHADKPVATDGASGKVIILAGKQKSEASLTPAGGNKLKGVARYASDAQMKAVVTVTFAGKPAEQAQYTPLAALSKAAADGGHGAHQH